MVASAKGHTKIVEVLLEKSRLDINMQDEVKRKISVCTSISY